LITNVNEIKRARGPHSGFIKHIVNGEDGVLDQPYRINLFNRDDFGFIS